MEVIDQTVDGVLESLSPLDVEWMDDIAGSAIAKFESIEVKPAYGPDDARALLDDNFEQGILCCRLFLALSADSMRATLRRELGEGGIGVTRYEKDPNAFIATLEKLGLFSAMANTINYRPIWSDILVERLRSGRGSAIQGIKRGRSLEDFAEVIVKEVYGTRYETRCTFVGADGKRAKCDFAIPDRNRPRIIIEVKGYAATGSKMTDIIGDLDSIIDAKRHDTALLFLTDGVTWKDRISDLRKIVTRQNEGKVTRIYTTRMGAQLKEDLETLKAELRI
jgi:hypothetical protein